MRTRSPTAAGLPRADHSLSPTRTRPPWESTGWTTTTTRPVYVTEVRSGEVVDASGASVIVRGEKGFQMYGPGEIEKRGIKIYRDGKRVDLSDLRKGDRLSATIVTEGPPQVMTEQQVQATLAKAPPPATSPGAGSAAGAAPAASASKPGATPAGVMGREVTIVADVVAVDPAKQMITLKGPVHSIDLRVDNPEQFKRIAKGDQVEAKFTQALAISVEPKK